VQNLKLVPIEVRGPVPLDISVLEFYRKTAYSFPGSDWTPRKLEGFIQAPRCYIHTKLAPCLQTSFNCCYPGESHPVQSSPVLGRLASLALDMPRVNPVKSNT